MSNHKDDKALEDYLQGGSDLSRRYQSGSEVEPRKELDAAIIKAARTAIAGPRGPVSRSWYVPLSLAAVVVIGVGVIFRMYEYKGQQLLTEPRSDLIQEQKSDSDKIEENSSTGTAAPATTPAPAPQAYHLQPERDDLQRALQSGAINEEPALKRPEQMAPAGGLRPPAKEMSIPQEHISPSSSHDVGPESKEKMLSKELQAPGFLDEKMRATGESSQISGAVPETRYQPATAPAETEHLSDTVTAEGRVLSETDWLAGIGKLWDAGKKDEAVAGLKQFLITYPQYPHEKIIKQLPGDFEPKKYISGFDKN